MRCLTFYGYSTKNYQYTYSYNFGAKHLLSQFISLVA